MRGGAFRLVDLESVNGTMVGGQKIEEYGLKHGEELQVGNTRLKLFTSAVADTPALEQAQKSSFALKIRPDEGVLTGTSISHYELGPILRAAPPAPCTRPAAPATARTSP